MNKKAVCLVIPSLQAGGMERVMSELATYFSKKDTLEVHIVLYGSLRERFYQVPDNVKVHLPDFSYRSRFRFIYILVTLFYLRRKIRSIDPFSILSFGELWNSLVLISMIGLRFPVYISDRCSPIRTYSWFHRILRHQLYRRAKGIIAQTDKAQEIYSMMFKHKNIVVIGNPIREIAASESIKKEKKVLMIGRLIESKNQYRLIDMFLRINLKEWQLVIVGYDHLKQSHFDRLKELIVNSKAEDRVFLEGKRDDVERYYLKSEIFAFTSTSEGFPNVIGEAMSAGLPVIAFDCIAGPSEMITDGKNGFLIPLNDYDQFQDKLKRLMLEESLRARLGNNARQDIKRFSLDMVGEKYYKLLTDLQS